MNVIAQQCARRPRCVLLCRRRGSIASILAKTASLENMEHKTSSILGCLLLTLVFLLALFAIGPVTNSLHENPVGFLAIGCRVKTIAFHLTTNSIRLETDELIAEIDIIDKLVARQNEAEVYLWP